MEPRDPNAENPYREVERRELTGDYVPPQQVGANVPPPPQGAWGAPPPQQGGWDAPPPPQGAWGASPPQQGGWNAPPPMPPMQPPHKNNTTAIVLGIVGGSVLLCILACVAFTIIPMMLIGGQVNNVFSSISSSLGTPVP